MSKFLLPCSLVLALLTGCDPGSEKAFLKGKALDPCAQVIPACPGLFAGCTLDSSRYAEVSFPGQFRFIVRAGVRDRIGVLIYLRTQIDAGLETQIYWNEPGCSEVYTYDSAGRNIFNEADETHVIFEEETVNEEGEHLIEIFSDMQAETYVSASVKLAGEP